MIYYCYCCLVWVIMQWYC